MLAHYLWERTRRGQNADEQTWISALDQAADDTVQLMRAIWRALTTNERRVARALAVVATPLYSEETATAVGIKRASIRAALESLRANADVIEEMDKPRLTDPMFELWLRERGLTPATGDD
jgi:response regulator of citrate/malate metabolism